MKTTLFFSLPAGLFLGLIWGMKLITFREAVIITVIYSVVVSFILTVPAYIRLWRAKK